MSFVLPAAPASLFDAATAGPAFGRYLGLPAELSTAHWDGDGGLLSPRRLQRKTWTYLGAFSPRYMVGYAVVDAGLVSTAFVYVYDRERRRLIEEKITRPLGFARDFAGSPSATWTLAQGQRRWRLSPQGGGWRAEFDSPALRLTLDAVADAQGMSMVAASPGRAFHATYKDCALACRIELEIGGERHAFDAPGMIDFSLGYPPRRTYWNWAAASGRTADGRSFGLNLVAHFNDGLENALWLDGRVIPLSQAVFIYEPQALDRPWRIATADGVLELNFIPEGRRSENVNALVLASRFAQMFGRYEGQLRLDGATIALEGLGVTEEHAAVW